DVYWTEMRPAEGGRYVVVRRTRDGRAEDLPPAPFNARTLVHEYGGGAFAVDRGTVYFSNYADQRLYRQIPGAPPEAITPAGAWRYADGVVDPRRGRIVCVREDHTDPSHEPVNALVSMDLRAPSPGRVLASGNDFYSSPRLSPDGARLAWLTWRHPNMPWDGTEVWVAEIGQDGALERAGRVAGGGAGPARYGGAHAPRDRDPVLGDLGSPGDARAGGLRRRVAGFVRFHRPARPPHGPARDAPQRDRHDGGSRVPLGPGGDRISNR